MAVCKLNLCFQKELRQKLWLALLCWPSTNLVSRLVKWDLCMTVKTQSQMLDPNNRCNKQAFYYNVGIDWCILRFSSKPLVNQYRSHQNTHSNSICLDTGCLHNISVIIRNTWIIYIFIYLLIFLEYPCGKLGTQNNRVKPFHPWLIICLEKTLKPIITLTTWRNLPSPQRTLDQANRPILYMLPGDTHTCRQW